MTKEWMEYDSTKKYENLYDRKKDECVVDIMLRNGKVVEMCVFNPMLFTIKHTFTSILEYTHLPIPHIEVSKIRLTHRIIKRYKYSGSLIKYYQYRQASPYYTPRAKRLKAVFDKTDKIFFPPY